MQTEHPRRLNSPLHSPQNLKRKCSKFRPASTGVFYCFTLHDHKYQRWSKKLPVHCNRALKTNTFAPSQSRGSSYGILIISSLLHPVKTQVREMSPAKPGSRDEHITLFFSLQRALSWLWNFPKLYFFHSSISSCSYLPKWMTCTGCSWLFIRSHYPNREPFPWKCIPQKH